ncbi:unnamed protein product [Caenorhabditis auriculariae]|uniref:Uncharacterized protein n=1 Tax=Caenorhabditis auriculariae TaxID=2777116 RepID=A0A8S1H277_9PELO|nr:unnamed protein product [Caenorhabditis auriculariae]
MAESDLKDQILLFMAVAKGNYDQVYRIVESGEVNVRHRNQEGKTVIMMPKYFEGPNAKDIFNYLVDTGLSVDAITKNGRTALHYAVDANNFLLVRLLMERDAKFIKDNDGNHPLFSTAMNLNASKVYHLLLMYVSTEMKADADLLRDSTKFLSELEKKGIKPHMLRAEMNRWLGATLKVKNFVNSLYVVPPEEDEIVMGCPRSAFYQCFVVREKVLGGRRHPAVRRAIYLYVNRLDLTLKVYEREKSLIRFMIFLYLEHEPLFVEDIVSHLVGRCQALFHKARQTGRREETKLSKVILASYIFELVGDILEKAPEHKEKIPNFREWCTTLSEFALEIFCKIDTVDATLFGSSEMQFLDIDVHRFVRCTNAVEVPLLHSLQFASKVKLVKLFVDAGANINGKDLKGETALAASFKSHGSFLQTLAHSPYYLPENYWPLVRELIRNGARIFVHKGRHSVWQMLRAQRGYNSLNNFSEEITLKDLAAQVVEAHYSMDYLKMKLPAADELQPHKLKCRRFIGLYF